MVAKKHEAGGRSKDKGLNVPAVGYRLLLAGDVHMDFGWLSRLIAVAVEERCEAIVQLGDLGFFPGELNGRAFLGYAEDLLAEAERPMYWLEGNHDDLQSLNQLRERRGAFVEMSPHLLYLPRGCRFSCHGIRFLAVGGAYSVDQGWRQRAERYPRTLWWPEEVLSDDDVSLACRGGEVDVLLAHDCPAGVVLPGIESLAASHENRRRLARIVDRTRPSLIVHGHYHLRHEGLYVNEALGLRVPTIGLAAENSGPDGWFVLDLGKPPFLLESNEEER